MTYFVERVRLNECKGQVILNRTSRIPVARWESGGVGGIKPPLTDLPT